MTIYPVRTPQRPNQSLQRTGQGRCALAQTALGVRSTQAGLLGEAEREFRAVLKTDPNNDTAKKLLADLRAK